MKKVLFILLLSIVFISCGDEYYYKNQFNDLENNLKYKSFANYKDYEEVIVKIEKFSFYIKDSVLLLKMQKKRDSLREWGDFTKNLNTFIPDLKNYDSLKKYKVILKPLIDKKIPICDYYSKVISNKETPIQLSKEEKHLVLKYAEKLCITVRQVEKEVYSNRNPDIITDSQIQNMLSSWDGSLPSLVDLVKKSMNDEDSFKHIQTGYINKGSYIEVKMIYSGKNAYNATIKAFIKVKVDATGKIIDIISSS